MIWLLSPVHMKITQDEQSHLFHTHSHGAMTKKFHEKSAESKEVIDKLIKISPPSTVNKQRQIQDS